MFGPFLALVLEYFWGIFHQIVAHRLAAEWWERQLPQYRTLPHSVELLPSSVLHQYRVLLNFTAILPMSSIWVLPVDYGVVRKSTLQKSHYSLILRLGADLAATPSFLCRQNQFCSADLSNANGPKKGQKFRKKAQKRGQKHLFTAGVIKLCCQRIIAVIVIEFFFCTLQV